MTNVLAKPGGLVPRDVTRWIVLVVMVPGILYQSSAWSVGAITHSASAQLPERFAGDSACMLAGDDRRTWDALRALTQQMDSITLSGMASALTSQLWMGLPLAMRTFALPTDGTSNQDSVVTRLARAQPLLEDLAVLNDGFMLAGRDDQTQWTAHWQITDGWARGWLSAMSFRLPAVAPDAHVQIRTPFESWLPVDARMITHHVAGIAGGDPHSQGIWELAQRPAQAVRMVTKRLVHDGWVSRSPAGNQWRRGSCVLDFRVLDSWGIKLEADPPADVHSFLWILSRRLR